MQNLVNDAPPAKKNFGFVDSIRAIAMMGIVYEHSSTLWALHYKSAVQTVIQASAMQFFKFSTIAFFLIGGFLINYKFTEYTPFQYIKKRFSNTFKPWLFWMIILIVLDVANEIVIQLKYGGADIKSGFTSFLSSEIYHTIFYTSFWFIPNFLVCITILLLFKKHLYKVWFGLFWLAVSLFYSVNLYYHWIVTEHSTALFGFVFYLWLGVYFNKNFDEIIRWISNTSFPPIILCNVVLFILSTSETIYLINKGSDDAFNTLRVTNIMYSLAAFVLLLKIGELKWLTKILEPRKTTFGIYLMHQILIIHLVIHQIYKPVHYDPANNSALINLAVSIGSFLLVYTLSAIITKVLVKTRARSLVGQ